ncbi:TetR family transcriptional regulator [Mycobacterium paraffinicum]|uniref:TetR family transcriptional regulator n=1 Tax=Mycobacterium paraffinicum TaxID=53378 RepID=A0A1Q4HS89_9MYCO|nr:TetR/AcrR family transcriptional regulator [Mycobacterium paraffinicum]OJZ72021.1 TetR family transcriptional regulator [Mycobacterium paraffinicum]
MAECIADVGYANTMVSDVVRRARTSKSKFYAEFADREACLVALLSETNDANLSAVAAAVDPRAPWQTQVRQAVETWFDWAERRRPLTLTWIRDVPALGPSARSLQRFVMGQFVELVHALSDTDELKSIGIDPVPHARAVMLIGGLRELTAHTVEHDQPLAAVTEEAVRSAIALINPST